MASLSRKTYPTTEHTRKSQVTQTKYTNERHKGTIKRFKLRDLQLPLWGQARPEKT